ncbi:MAG: hypothetical protein GDA50_04390 [Alphaproteobacteria bacterium GM202ARS2]|nr:hypothetical protein [Alphaproteobacteria bacterium GM202ARS2]
MKSRNELAAELKVLYKKTRPKRKATDMARVFGIVYADNIKNMGLVSPVCLDIAREANIPDTYGVEIYKGVNLSPYVMPKPDILKAF